MTSAPTKAPFSRTKDSHHVGRVRLVRRGKRGYWTMEYHAQRRHCRKATGVKTLKPAKKLAAQLNADLENHKIGNLAPAVADAVKLYLSSTKSRHWRPSTKAAYTAELTAFERYCLDRRHRRISEVTPAALEAYAQHRAESPSPTSGRPRTKPAATAHKAKLIVLGLFRWLEQGGHLATNPLTKVSNPMPRRQRPQPPRMEDAIRIVKAGGEAERTYLKVLMYTGIRLGELQRLSSKDVDFDAGFLHIRSTQAQPTKTGTSRKVPIHPDLVQDLRAAVAAAADSPVLFARNPSDPPERRRPLNDNSVLLLVKRLARSLGLPAGQAQGGWTPHLFRHCLETFAVNRGVPQRAVDVWLGHLGDASSSRVYYHLDDTESVRHMNGLKLPEA